MIVESHVIVHLKRRTMA